MKFLDDKNIIQFGLCAKKFYTLSRNEQLWECISPSNYLITSDKNMTSLEHYKWCLHFPIRFSIFLDLLGYFYELDENLEYCFKESLKIASPNCWIDIEIV